MRRKISYSRIFGAAAAAVIIIFSADFVRRRISSDLTDEELNNSITVSEKYEEKDKFSLFSVNTDSDIIDLPDSEDGLISAKYHNIKVENSEAKKGPLILINKDHPIDPSYTASEIAVLNSNKNTSSYKLAYMDLSADKSIISSLNKMFDDFYSKYSIKDVTVSSAYVSYEEQKEKYKEPSSDQITSDEMMKPGCSEHQTGCAVDLLIVSDGMSISRFDGTGDYSWIISNCSRYGFIQRYPSGKEKETGVSEMPGHLRYVGAPHSYIINEKRITLEEYLNLMRGYQYDGQHYRYQTSDYEYEIYYVPAGTDVTDIPVPYEYQYSISGTNSGGFIVTVSILRKKQDALEENTEMQQEDNN